MTTLREARDKGKLDQFIKEREGEKGDAAAVDRTISAMAAPAKGKSKKR
jgi:hypothetical protein